MIEIRNLKKEYPNVTPLKDVTTKIDAGEVISIIGPSGTGKSTLLRCVNMLETPTSGKIIVDGVDITDKKCDICKVRRKMGMVFQSFNLFEHMNIIENIMFAPVQLLKKSRQEAYDEGMRLLATVGLAEKSLSYPCELSGGQKQRIAIVRTLAMNPEIILFDEPTSALDPTMVGEVLSVIRSLAKQKLTMMIVTHEMKFARDVSTRIFYMDEGGIYEDGTPQQIFENPQKEKTRQFIKRLKVFRREITSREFDFLGMYSEIESFAVKHAMTRKKINNVFTVADELLMQGIVPKIGTDAKIVFMMEYSEDTEKCEISISYGGEKRNAVEGIEDISLALIKNVSEDIKYTYEDTNNIKIVLK